MDYTNKFGRVISETDDIACAADECNKICNQEIKKIVINFADWLRYDDEIFGLYGENKITTENLYNRFLDELKP
jgi:hypothetical protein